MPYRPSISIRMNITPSQSSCANRQAIIANLVKEQQVNQSKAPSSLYGPMVGRIHNVRPGCGSCGK